MVRTMGYRIRNGQWFKRLSRSTPPPPPTTHTQSPIPFPKSLLFCCGSEERYKVRGLIMKGVTSSVIRPKQHEERGKPPPENITEYGFGKTTSLSLGTRPSPQSINLLKVLCLFAFSHLKHVFHSLKTQSLNSSNLPFLSFFCSFTPSPPIHLILLLTLSPPFG